MLIRATRGAFFGVLSVWLAISAVAVVGVAALLQSARPGRSAYEGSVWGGLIEPRFWQDVASGWEALRLESPGGRPEFWIVVAFAGLAAFWTCVASVNVTRVQRAEPYGAALMRALRAQTASLGFVTLLALHALLDSALDNEAAILRPLFPTLEEARYPLLWSLTLCLSLLHISRAIRLNPSAAVPEIPFRCEDCGYDLSMTPPDGCCPECGLPAAASHPDGMRRAGVVWENRGRSRLPTLSTGFRVLCSPGRFYGGLRMRTGLRAAHRFNRQVKIAAAIGGPLWLATVFYAVRDKNDAPPLSVRDLVGIAIAMACWTPVVITVGQRICAGMFTSWWQPAGRVADAQWAEKVVLYESAYLWVFLAFWGVLVTSFILWNDWISRAIDTIRPWLSQRLFGGIFPEFVVLVGGTALLALVWLLRYEIALRAVRYNNA